jgi:hypothetical protein
MAEASNATGIARSAAHKEIWLYLATLAALASLGDLFVASVDVAAITKVILHAISNTNSSPSTPKAVFVSIDAGSLMLPIVSILLLFCKRRMYVLEMRDGSTYRDAAVDAEAIDMELQNPIGCLQRPVSSSIVAVRPLSRWWTLCLSRLAIANVQYHLAGPQASLTFFVWCRCRPGLTKCFIYPGGCSAARPITTPWVCEKPPARRVRGPLSCVLPLTSRPTHSWYGSSADVRGAIAGCIVAGADTAIVTCISDRRVRVEVC